jgi:hypothetical protein
MSPRVPDIVLALVLGSWTVLAASCLHDDYQAIWINATAGVIAVEMSNGTDFEVEPGKTVRSGHAMAGLPLAWTARNEAGDEVQSGVITEALLVDREVEVVFGARHGVPVER